MKNKVYNRDKEGGDSLKHIKNKGKGIKFEY